MIKQELEKKTKEKELVLEQASFLSNVKQLLDSEEQRDLTLVQNAFPNSTKSLVLEERSKMLKVNRLEDQFEGSVYTHSQIKDICMKYRLRFLSSGLFKGEVPFEAIVAIKEKIKNPKLKFLEDLSRRELTNNLFVVAPSEMFKLQDGNENKKERIRIEKLRKIAAKDPALFLRLDESHYLFIKEWGNSFSPMRRILGALTAKNSLWRFYFVLAWIAIVATFGSIAFSLFPEGNVAGFFEISKLTLAVFLSIATAFVAICSFFDAETSFVFARWKHEKKGLLTPDPLLATETNWDVPEKI